MNNDSKDDKEKKEEVKNAFRERSLAFYDNSVDITADYNQAGTLIQIEKLIREIESIKSNDDLFSIGGQVGKKTIVYKNPWICNRIVNYCKNPFLIDEIEKSFPIYAHHPYIEKFISILKDTVTKIDRDIHLNHDQLNHDELVKRKVILLNDCFASIRSEVNSKPFKKTINNYQRLQRKNSQSLVNYIDKLVNHNARLLVVRIKLSYRKDDHILKDDERKKKYFQIKNDRERFFKEIRSNKTPFKGVLGYAWKLEYGQEKGFHLHVLLILDGSKLQQDVNIAQIFGEFWKNKITDGNGLYFNCNADKDRYKKYLGIGMINYYDTQLREGLEKAAEYLTKTDYYMRLIAPDKGRTFGKGEIKSESSRRGRPREHYATPAQV